MELVARATGNEDACAQLEADLAERVDGSVLLYVTNLRGEPAGHVGEIMDGPLYDSLPAVSAGRAFPGGKDTVGGFEDANYNLDLLEEELAQPSRPAKVPSP